MRLTRIAFFACSSASQGAGRSRKTVEMVHVRIAFRKERRAAGNEAVLTCVYFVLGFEAVLVYVTVLDGDDIIEAVLLEFDPAATTV